MTAVLVLGFDPMVVAPNDAAAFAPAFEHARNRADAEDIEYVECLVGFDGADLRIRAALLSRQWDCVVIGGGIRKPDSALDFFEYITNLVHVCCPTSVIAFNTSPADSVDAALRAIAVRDRL